MNQERLLNIILSPHISEKATTVMEKNNEYVFSVVKDASKSEVKDAIEFLFNTKVKAVRVATVRAKKKMFKGIEGNRKSWKKAYVTLQADQKLDMMVAQ
ncbi:MAG: 50S ribosomal protein L23 [Gammaproteobacteria bacterium RIFCSPHIGHO2_12_FULL_43_28]|nr:MAG: 50S ribosomal protein L23 [Gammaproteobacteria bacterium RIFCSPHIGHO2_12_FULL_43_28]